jgi:hypothetical protein
MTPQSWMVPEQKYDVIPDIRPTRCMEIMYRIRGRGGETVDGVIHNTIHKLGDGEANADNSSPIPGSATR